MFCKNILRVYCCLLLFVDLKFYFSLLLLLPFISRKTFSSFVFFLFFRLLFLSFLHVGFAGTKTTDDEKEKRKHNRILNTIRHWKVWWGWRKKEKGERKREIVVARSTTLKNRERIKEEERKKEGRKVRRKRRFLYFVNFHCQTKPFKENLPCSFCLAFVVLSL